MTSIIRIPTFSTLLLLTLFGCNTVPVHVPKVKIEEPIKITNKANLAKIKFDRIGIKIKRGTIIGNYKSDALGFDGCAFLPGNIFWNQGRQLTRDLEFSDIFFEEMQAANINVIGNPDKMFAQADTSRENPSFLIGGQLEDLKLNVCMMMNAWTGRLTGLEKGEGSVRVRWQIFSVLDQKVVYETTTEGSAKLEAAIAAGSKALILDAFGNATANLAANRKFVDLLLKQKRSVADIRDIDAPVMEIESYPVWNTSITDRIDLIRNSVVTIETGLGHGSGFFITPTLIMTNFHVTENSDLLRVRLLTGRKILGEVIRRHPQRDVAIIQVERSGRIPLPIRSDPLKITEPVFAIGSPLDKSLSGTVNKGIVSKFTSNRHGLEDIQADVDIQSGNSGGVLLDSNGNVVGITYAGIGPNKEFSAGLNFFIPIMDALKKLNIAFKSNEAKS